MKKLLALVVVFCGPMLLSLGTTGCTTKETEKGKGLAEERKSDHDLIQGRWKNEFIRLVFTVETLSQGPEGGQNTAMYKLDPSKKPKAIDITPLSGSER